MEWVKKIVYRKAILMLFESPIYKWLILKVFPYVRFTCYYTSFRGWKYHRGYDLLMPGDIILTNDKWKLTSFLVPGEWTHAALCISKDGNFEIAEMTHTNFTRSTFFDLCRESTRVMILRCRDWDLPYLFKVIAECLTFAEAEYDIRFEEGPTALYCSELVVASDPEKRLQVSMEDVLGLGMLYISPTGISKAKNVDIIWDSNNEVQEG